MSAERRGARGRARVTRPAERMKIRLLFLLDDHLHRRAFGTVMTRAIWIALPPPITAALSPRTTAPRYAGQAKHIDVASNAT
ncbi:hypothetical protein WS73_24420 [Burkholderia savannae]|nr:hypothetical protein WS73_24420 [Burkholderia savannae]